jgi:hypothetical protein
MKHKTYFGSGPRQQHDEKEDTLPKKKEEEGT